MESNYLPTVRIICYHPKFTKRMKNTIPTDYSFSKTDYIAPSLNYSLLGSRKVGSKYGIATITTYDFPYEQ